MNRRWPPMTADETEVRSNQPPPLSTGNTDELRPETIACIRRISALPSVSFSQCGYLRFAFDAPSAAIGGFTIKSPRVLQELRDRLGHHAVTPRVGMDGVGFRLIRIEHARHDLPLVRNGELLREVRVEHRGARDERRFRHADQHHGDLPVLAAS